MRTHGILGKGGPNSVGPSAFIEVGRERNRDIPLLFHRLGIAPVTFEQ